MRIYDYSGGIDPKEYSQDDDIGRQWNTLMSYKRKWGGAEYPYYHFSLNRKSFSYKIMRGLLKTDWMFREKKKQNYIKKC